MRFQPGQFFGAYQARRSLLDCQLADLRPTVPEHEVAVHTHDDAHFVLLLSGRYVSSARGMPAICVQPTLLLNPPGTCHRDHFHGMDGQFFTLSLTANAWRDIEQAFPLPDTALRMDDGELVAAYRLWNELYRWDDVSPLVVESECRALLGAAAGATTREDERGPAWLNRARERLQDDSLCTPPLTELAREADLHPVYFARAFRRRYGCSPGQYLRRCRLSRAVALLCRSKLAMAQIAADCGFVDQSHLCHAFHNAYGISPTVFRRSTHQKVSSIQDEITAPA